MSQAVTLIKRDGGGIAEHVLNLLRSVEGIHTVDTHRLTRTLHAHDTPEVKPKHLLRSRCLRLNVSHFIVGDDLFSFGIGEAVKQFIGFGIIAHSFC